MNTKELINKINHLPSDLKTDLNDYLTFLNAHGIIDKIKQSQKKIQPGFGGGKGIFGAMSENFNEPLEDFKDYM
ncbi:DUF2281 domain-containing protein [Mucilaginibacter terrigena]|uniref:DUF2281 domain-containing protein n=1 Tax=Mucilaginibacter terrigena TaxID=2492395 RepID=A0A4V1ZBC5_9SPHI|nr:DUF2281 domain-containing protein [Mucilaginibacter terrigena]RYU85876.1 DUF2281 domain-containing protein [Mucilaginibacter terrigena]